MALPSSLRAKFFGIAASTAFAFVLVLVASSLMAKRVDEHLVAIQARHIPRLELGPQLEADFAALRRGFQDAVAAHDAEMLDAARDLRDHLVERLDRGQPLLGPGEADAARSAILDYYDAALDVSRRMIAKESGEPIVDAIARMQQKQANAQRTLERATTPDTRALTDAFTAARSAQTTATNIRLGLTMASLFLVLLVSFWLNRSIVRSLRVLEAGFDRYGDEAFDEPIPTTSGDEFAELASGANRMAEKLARLAAERERAQWVGTGLVELADVLSGELDEREVATRATRQLASYAGALAAALYRRTSDDTLRLLGDHAGSDIAPSFRIGEGLVGQAAAGQDIVVIEDVPPDFFRIRSGLGEGVPRCLVLVPLHRSGSLVGILELAYFKGWSAAASELLLKARDSVAIALEVAQSRAETRALLARTQEQAGRLSAQEEELRAANEVLQTQQEELRQTNEELAQQAEELEVQRSALEERNTALQAVREHLEKQTRELSTVSAYKSQFLANMSHELRTPLNSMLLLSNLLTENSDKNLTDKQIEYAKTINSSGRDLLALINQVLDRAKVEAGKQEVRAGRVNLGELAARKRSLFTPLARDKGLVLEVQIADDAPHSITSDERLIVQVINNLLGNAIKFTERGGVTLRIGAPEPTVRFRRAGLERDKLIAFSVRDTGPGIAASDFERIFEPFEQIDATVGRRHGGTGLGLNIARELATLLGGELQVESIVGKGSTFVLFVPRERSAESSARTPAEDPSGSDAERPSRPVSGAELLLIEDDPTFADVVRQVVSDQGLGFAHAMDGATGVRLAQQRQPKGIILDIKLPDIDGRKVLEQLQADPRTSKIPVHLVSALELPERAPTLGATGYLTKPATKQDLSRVVEALVPSSGRAPCRILVVEDDIDVGDSVLRQLAGERLEARRVTTARDALALVEKEHFACIILDLSLPDMSGLDVLEHLQGIKDREMPAVVVYTGRPLSKAETTKLEAYAEAVVVKDGSSAERLLHEIRLFVRRLQDGVRRRRAPVRHLSSELRLEQRKILVVDDDMRTVYALSAALRAKGAEVLVAENGAVALGILADHPAVDVVLMDIMMPEMDGYEATRRIRQQPRFKDLPIVALTAKAMKGDEQRCLAAGATDYLPKPVDIDRLLDLMSQRLSQSSG